MLKFRYFMPLLLMACSTNSGEAMLSLQEGDVCEEVCRDTNGQDGILICHVPPGNLENPLTLCVGAPGQLNGHVQHEADSCGSCEPLCGDQVCSEGEDCENCPQDCGECPSECGDQVCDEHETCECCPEDCGECEHVPECGDQTCDEGESCRSCEVDCGACEPTPHCGDGNVDEGEDCHTCPEDAGQCPPECGDQSCNGDETCGTCPTDCGECPEECGNQFCGENEDCSTCPADCGPCSTCGDQTCDEGEDCEKCPGDCGFCPCDGTFCECFPELSECQDAPDAGPDSNDSPGTDAGPEDESKLTVEGGGCSASGNGGNGFAMLGLLLVLGVVSRKSLFSRR